jgi:hypothetical protein
MAEMSSIGSGLIGLAIRDDDATTVSGVESSGVHSGSTLESYVLPSNLRMGAKETKPALTCMEVIKVSKVRIECCFMVINCGISIIIMLICRITCYIFYHLLLKK